MNTSQSVTLLIKWLYQKHIYTVYPHWQSRDLKNMITLQRLLFIFVMFHISIVIDLAHLIHNK